jgi:membrane protein YqaA with SNARE-associated domain
VNMPQHRWAFEKMEETKAESGATTGAKDGISVSRWFLLFAAYLAVLGVPTVLMLSRLDGKWTSFFTHFGDFHEPWQQVLKLLIFAIYLSFCCTFLPLPTGWLVAAVGTREMALAGGVWSTALLVGAAGALGSMMANLNDYHIFTLMLRHHRVAAVRNTRMYASAARWFAEAPFAILLIFNIVPIPVDVIRMLAATARYERFPFAISTFLGRFIRYGVLAGLAFQFNIRAWLAAAIMLAIAAALGAIRLAPAAVRALGRR